MFERTKVVRLIILVLSAALVLTMTFMVTDNASGTQAAVESTPVLIADMLIFSTIAQQTYVLPTPAAVLTQYYSPEEINAATAKFWPYGEDEAKMRKVDNFFQPVRESVLPFLFLVWLILFYAVLVRVVK